MARRLYSREFPEGVHPVRYLLDGIPRDLWLVVKAMADREPQTDGTTGVSMRALILRLLTGYVRKTRAATPVRTPAARKPRPRAGRAAAAAP